MERGNARTARTYEEVPYTIGASDGKYPPPHLSSGNLEEKAHELIPANEWAYSNRVLITGNLH
jgi:hypothetical protein